MSFKDKKNVYTCDECGSGFVTQDLDEGTTPFMTKCDQEKCEGMCTSMMYQPDRMLSGKNPKYVWRKPTTSETSKLEIFTLQHVEKGGLLLAHPAGGLV